MEQYVNEVDVNIIENKYTLPGKSINTKFDRNLKFISKDCTCFIDDFVSDPLIDFEVESFAPILKLSNEYGYYNCTTSINKLNKCIVYNNSCIGFDLSFSKLKYDYIVDRISIP